MTGTGFQPGVTAVMLVLQGGGWQQEVPASAMTIDAGGTTMSFAMPEGPAGGGLVGMVAFVPGIQAQFVPAFTYAPSTAPSQRVAADGAALPATGNDTGVLLATATGAVMIGVGMLAVARRRRGLLSGFSTVSAARSMLARCEGCRAHDGSGWWSR